MALDSVRQMGTGTQLESTRDTSMEALTESRWKPGLVPRMIPGKVPNLGKLKVQQYRQYQ